MTTALAATHPARPQHHRRGKFPLGSSRTQGISDFRVNDLHDHFTAFHSRADPYQKASSQCGIIHEPHNQDAVNLNTTKQRGGGHERETREEVDPRDEPPQRPRRTGTPGSPIQQAGRRPQGVRTRSPPRDGGGARRAESAIAPDTSCKPRVPQPVAGFNDWRLCL